jgi:hypothetical protein
LRRITGNDLAAGAWRTWWARQGEAKPGLLRTGPGRPAQRDAQVDFGGWWRGVIRNTPNPLVKYDPPATIRWHGKVVIPRDGTYRFSTHSLGEGLTIKSRIHFSNGQPTGFWFQPGCVRLTLDGRQIIPGPGDEVIDPTCGMRLDLANPVPLKKGLHSIDLEFEWRGGPVTDIWFSNQPTVRLYWSSDHFLRTVVPARALLTAD